MPVRQIHHASVASQTLAHTIEAPGPKALTIIARTASGGDALQLVR
jgi:hypothetical protein